MTQAHGHASAVGCVVWRPFPTVENECKSKVSRLSPGHEKEGTGSKLKVSPNLMLKVT